MTRIAFRSPVEVRLLLQGQPKPPGLPLTATFRIIRRAKDPEKLGPGGKHMAIDIGNFDCGAPIVAMAPGTAHRTEDEAKKKGAETNALGIIIDHGSGVTTEYWHFQSFLVADGTRVKAGDRIGRVGDTGIADGCHCHIELKVNGRHRDPEPQALGKTLELSGRSKGTAMPLTFKATDYRAITNRRFVTDKKARFREAPNTRSRILKTFPSNIKVIPSGVVKGEAIAGGAPRQGLRATDWLEARMKVGTNVVLGYFHASVLTNKEVSRVATSITDCGRLADQGGPMTERIMAKQFHAAEGAEAWRILPEGASAFFRSDSFATSVRFVSAIGEHVGDGDAPHVDIRSDGVTILLRAFREAGYGLFQPDLDFARAISTTARELGLTPDPAAVQSLLVIPGATDRSGIMPFWQAVLGYKPRPDSPDEDLVDPHDRLAPFWFEEMDDLRSDGKGSIHLVVWVPWDQAEARVAAGLAAGGRQVRYNAEELFWTLADPAGNEIDIGTAPAPEA